jgi:hypothetical protein
MPKILFILTKVYRFKQCTLSKIAVGVKLKNDTKTYFYYKKDGEIILESYVEDGVEYVQ